MIDFLRDPETERIVTGRDPSKGTSFLLANRRPRRPGETSFRIPLAPVEIAQAQEATFRRLSAVERAMGRTEQPETAIPERSWLEYASDTGLRAGRGALGATSALTDLAGADSAPSSKVREWQADLESLSSPTQQAIERSNAREAEALGPDATFLERGWLTAKQAARDPIGLIAEGAGNIVPLAVAGAVAAPFEIPAMTAAVGTGVLMGAGAIKGQIFDTIMGADECQLMEDADYAKMRSEGVPPEDARQKLAASLQSYAKNPGKIAAGAVLGGIAGRFGADEAIASLARGGAKNVVRDILEREALGASVKGALTGAGKEAWTEGLQEGGEQLLGNLGAAHGGARIDPTSGVPEAAVSAALMSAVPGAASHVAGGLHAKRSLSNLDAQEQAATAAIEAERKRVAETTPIQATPLPFAPPTVQDRAPNFTRIFGDDPNIDPRVAAIVLRETMAGNARPLKAVMDSGIGLRQGEAGRAIKAVATDPRFHAYLQDIFEQMKAEGGRRLEDAGPEPLALTGATPALEGAADTEAPVASGPEQMVRRLIQAKEPPNIENGIPTGQSLREALTNIAPEQAGSPENPEIQPQAAAAPPETDREAQPTRLPAVATPPSPLPIPTGPPNPAQIQRSTIAREEVSKRVERAEAAVSVAQDELRDARKNRSGVGNAQRSVVAAKKKLEEVKATEAKVDAYDRMSEADIAWVDNLDAAQKGEGASRANPEDDILKVFASQATTAAKREAGLEGSGKTRTIGNQRRQFEEGANRVAEAMGLPEPGSYAEARENDRIVEDAIQKGRTGATTVLTPKAIEEGAAGVDYRTQAKGHGLDLDKLIRLHRRAKAGMLSPDQMEQYRHMVEQSKAMDLGRGFTESITYEDHVKRQDRRAEPDNEPRRNQTARENEIGGIFKRLREANPQGSTDYGESYREETPKMLAAMWDAAEKAGSPVLSPVRGVQAIRQRGQAIILRAGNAYARVSDDGVIDVAAPRGERFAAGRLMATIIDGIIGGRIKNAGRNPMSDDALRSLANAMNRAGVKSEDLIDVDMETAFRILREEATGVTDEQRAREARRPEGKPDRATEAVSQSERRPEEGTRSLRGSRGDRVAEGAGTPERTPERGDAGDGNVGAARQDPQLGGLVLGQPGRDVEGEQRPANPPEQAPRVEAPPEEDTFLKAQQAPKGFGEAPKKQFNRDKSGQGILPGDIAFAGANVETKVTPDKTAAEMARDAEREAAEKKAYAAKQTSLVVDAAAADADPNPTEAQKEAGNYRKGHVTISGMEISIENKAGSKRKPEWPAMKSHYGYFLGTIGKDKDHIDVFVKPATSVDYAGPVFVVNQHVNGRFDETKVMLGFPTESAARRAYLENYTKGWKGLESMASFPDVDAFKTWLKEGDHTKPAPVAGRPTVGAEKVEPKAPPVVSANTVFKEDAYAAAKARMAARGKKLGGGTPQAGIDPEMMTDGLTMAGYHIERGARTFAAYAKAMISDLGDWVKPYLRGFYENVRYYPGFDSTGMSTADEVDAALADTAKGYNVREESPNEEQPLEQQPERDAGNPDQDQGVPGRDAVDIRPLEPVEAESGQATGGGRDTDVQASGTGGSGARGRRPSRPGIQSPDSRGENGTRGASAPALNPPRDFVIDESVNLGAGGAKSKFKGNVEAIRLIRKLAEEGRRATAAEQAVLVKYVGWGGIKQAFNPRDSSWKAEHDELKALLSPEEYLSARASVLNAHYTPKPIVEGLWSAMRHLGFKRGRVLEPASGVGHFIGLAPPGSIFTAIELDKTTSEILKHLYQRQNVVAGVGFQDVNILPGSMDIAIGNPPFGNESLSDNTGMKIPQGLSIHNFFFAKSLETLRPGGVLGMVVSNSFMDAKSPITREWLAKRATLLGAIRLPNNAFSKNAGTEVTTDIIFLQKRDSMSLPDDVQSDGVDGGLDWIGTDTYKNADGESMELNNYFRQHPEMMLGDMKLAGTMYRAGQSALIAKPGQDTSVELARAIEALPKNVFKEQTHALDTLTDVDGIVPEGLKVGSMFVTPNGRVAQRLEDVAGQKRFSQEEPKNGRHIPRLRGLISVRDSLADLMRKELTDAPDKEIAAARGKLNAVYDGFVKEFGYINHQANRTTFRDDIDLPRLESLEPGYDAGMSKDSAKRKGVDPRPPSAGKADIFNKRVAFPFASTQKADTPKEALLASLNERGYVDLAFMAKILGSSQGAVLESLKGLVYEDPAGQGFIHADEYLGGNVKAKLKAAQDAVESGKVQFEDNVSALEKVIPPDIDAVDIGVRIGSPWIPGEDMGDFVTHLVGGRHSFSFVPAVGRWFFNPGNADVVKNSQTWGTPKMAATDIIAALASNKAIVVRENIGTRSEPVMVVDEEGTTQAQAKAEEIVQAFNDWIWADQKRRDRLGRLYNDTFNTDAPKKFDGSHLTLPGTSPLLGMRTHQNSVIWRVLQDRTVLFDHVVGAGKTFAGIASIMESKRLGISRKPMIVVPNHLVRQWRDDFYRLYPNANILATTEADFQKQNRQRLFAKISTGDWDAVIVAKDSMKKVGMPPEAMKAVLGEQLADVMEAIEAMKREKSGDRNITRDLEKIRAGLEEKLKRAEQRAGEKDKGVTFDELGTDGLFVDEAHEFKNLFFFSSMRTAGLGNPKGSGRAFDLFVKMRYLDKRYGGKALRIFATGTPVSNSLVEMYTMQRFMQYDALKDRGIHTLDAWAGAFGNIANVYEVDTSGQGYRMKSRFAQFVNMPELMGLYKSFADIVTTQNLEDQSKAEGKVWPVPRVKGGKPRVVAADRSPRQSAYFGIRERDPETGLMAWTPGSIMARIEAEPKIKDKRIDNMLKITNDARLASLDMRLVDPGAPDHEGSKVNKAADEIVRIYKDSNDDKGTQLVFLDISTPKSHKGEATKRAQAIAAAEAADVDGAEQDDDSKVQDEGQEAEETVSMDDLLADQSDFSVYDDLRAKLIAKGIPEKSIAFIHDYNTALRKKDLFAAVNRGDIRILFGSTGKMGAGMNVQERLVALHHLDAPWKPSDLEQREGRIIRQGNLLYARDPEGFEVDIARYGTKQTYDTRMWQLIEHKARGIAQVRNGDPTIRTIEDVEGEAANASEMKAAVSGNPLIEQEIKLRGALKKLESLYQGFKRNKFTIESQISQLQREHDRGLERAADLETVSRDVTPKDPFAMTVNGRKVAEKRDAAGPILDAFKSATGRGTDGGDPIQYRGFVFRFVIVPRNGVSVVAEHEGIRDFNIANYGESEQISPSGLITRMDNFVESLPGRAASERRLAAAAMETREGLFVEAAKPFTRVAELEQARKDHAAILRDLKKSERDHEREDDQAEWRVFDKMGDALSPVARADTQAEAEKIATEMRYGPMKPESDVRFSANEKDAESVGLLSDEKVYDIAAGVLGADTARRRLVVTSFDQLPKRIQEAAKDQGLRTQELQGVYFQGKMYLIADSFDSASRVEEAVFHEYFTHFGLRARYGESLSRKLSEVVERVGGINGVLKVAQSQGVDLSAYVQGIEGSQDLSAIEKKLLLTEELLAHMSAATGTFRRSIDEIVGAIRDFLRQNGFARLSKYGVTDLAHILRQARLAAKAADDPTTNSPVFMRRDDSPKAPDVRYSVAARVDAPATGRQTVDRPEKPFGTGRPLRTAPMDADALTDRVIAASNGTGTPKGTPIEDLAPPDFHRNMGVVLKSVPKDEAEKLARIYDAFDKEMNVARGKLSWEQGNKESLKLLGIHSREQFMDALKRGVVFNEPGLRAATRIMHEVREEHETAMAALNAAREKGGGAIGTDEYRRVAATSADIAAWTLALRGEQAEAARAFNARKDLRGARTDVEKALGRMAKEIGGLTDAQAAELVRIAELEPDKLPDAIRRLQKPGFWDYVNEWRKGAMLWSPRTFLGVNTFGNALKQALTMLEIPVAAAIDTARAGKDGERQVYAGELAASFAGLADYGPDSLKKLTANLSAALRGVETFDQGSENRYDLRVGVIPGPLGKIIRTPFRVMTAADNFFKEMARAQSLYRSAYRRARNEGLTGTNATKRADELMAIGKGSQWADRRVAGMIDKANRTAEYETFTSPVSYETAGIFGALAQAVQKVEKKVGAVGLFVPFKGTPAHIAYQSFERSPLGFFAVRNRVKELHALRQSLETAKGAQKDMIEADLKAKTEELVNQAARAVIGTAVFAVAASMAAMGSLTGSGPADPEDRKVWMAAGNIPTGIKVGDSDWYGYDRFEPAAASVALAASLPEVLKGDTIGKQFAAFLNALQDAWVSKTYLQGLEQFGDVITDPQRYGEKWLRDLQGSFVPSAVAQAAETVDPTVRDNTGGGLDAIKARIPGLSQDLPARRTGTGEPATRTERFGGGSPLNPFGFIRTGSSDGDPLSKEFLDAGYAPTPHRKTITIGVGPTGYKKRHDVDLTPQELDLFRRADERTTQRLRRLIDDPRWKDLDPYVKKIKFQRAYDKASAAVRDLILPRAQARLRKQLTEGRANG